MILVEDWINESRETRRQHLDLSEPCLERGGNSTNHKGVLAQYLDTNIPSGRLLLCHACHNGKCSNPKHLYWGTDKDNIIDSKENGTHCSPWDSLVKKYGYDEACKMNSRKMIGNTHATALKDKPKSEEHKRKIAANHKGGKKKNASVA